MILKEVVSYASREPRVDETEGVEHYFISREKAEDMIKNNEIKIKTEINGIIYFATDDEIRSKNTYKIDPIGLRKFKEEYTDLNIKTIYIYCPTIIRKCRAINNRGLLYNFDERNISEDKQFNDFEINSEYDYKINNINLKESIDNMIQFLNNNPADMYCIVGRTGSGKDTIIKETNKVLIKNK